MCVLNLKTDQDSNVFYKLAMALYHLGELEQSLEFYNKAIKLDPNDSRNYYNRGNTYLALG